ncbi:hypothetical protein HID58_008669 [Brassica napus]|uniref:Uncharacterized protein n=1 Tax=Brassica napus TaxID=3708 RepID=A0ABQ8DR79_BRANA|nr:hypothetical protein HID58_008669 [Brassica napus]
MAKSYGALFLLALIVFSLLQTMVMASSGSRVKYNPKRYGPGSLKRSRKSNAPRNVIGGVARHNTTTLAFCSATNAAGSVCVCLRGIMETNKFALATTTGKLKRVDQNALKTSSNRF